jgi:hypothetical protein
MSGMTRNALITCKLSLHNTLPNLWVAISDISNVWVTLMHIYDTKTFKWPAIPHITVNIFSQKIKFLKQQDMKNCHQNLK